MFIKPKTGLMIRDPEMEDFLPSAGREVSKNSYWIRRLRDGDVLESKPVKVKQDKESK